MVYDPAFLDFILGRSFTSLFLFVYQHSLHGIEIVVDTLSVCFLYV